MKQKPQRLPGHVFLSYAHEDYERVKPVVDYLATRNLDVWWDRRLQAGQEWSRVLEEKLRTASCVVVVWTHKSVDSRFVRSEARDALNRAKNKELVICVRLDTDASIPLPFGELQYADLTNWRGGPSRELRHLGSVARRLAMRRSEWDDNGSLAQRSDIEGPRRAAADLRQATARISALADILAAEAKPAADLRATLKEVHKTYDAVNDAVAKFVAAAVSEGSASRRVFARFERGSLKKLIRDGRGHCHLIYQRYYGRRGLREWLKDRVTSRKLQEADRAFGRLAGADFGLFDDLARIGNILTNESRAIVNLLIADQEEASRRRIASGRKRLLPVERELEKGIRQLQTLEQRLGYVGRS